MGVGHIANTVGSDVRQWSIQLVPVLKCSSFKRSVYKNGHLIFASTLTLNTKQINFCVCYCSRDSREGLFHFYLQIIRDFFFLPCSLTKARHSSRLLISSPRATAFSTYDTMHLIIFTCYLNANKSDLQSILGNEPDHLINAFEKTLRKCLLSEPHGDLSLNTENCPFPVCLQAISCS